MTDAGEDKALQHLLVARFVRLNSLVHGIVLGLVLGLGIFVATNWLVIKGGRVIGPHLALLGQFFIGYRVTFGGSLIGFVYGFGLGFLMGYFVTLMYNWVADLRERKTPGARDQ